MNNMPLFILFFKFLKLAGINYFAKLSKIR